MIQEELNEFAKLLVQNVRDLAIRSCDVQLYTNNMKSPTAKRWRDAKNGGNIDKFAETVIADSVDDAIFYLLLAVDEGVLNISFNAPNGKVVSLTPDVLGELGGYYAGEWRSKYSAERWSDDLAD